MGTAATSAGTLVLIALSGGAGALLGTILGQAVQLHRDKRQREHENARHDRERQETLDDARTIRREERYSATLTAAADLRMQAQQCTVMVRMWNDILRLMETPQVTESARPLLADVLATRADQQEWLMTALRNARSAANAAYPVASGKVRKACVKLATQPLLFRPVVLTEHGPVLPPDAPAAVARALASSASDYATASIKELSELVARCDDLDALMRAELRLD